MNQNSATTGGNVRLFRDVVADSRALDSECSHCRGHDPLQGQVANQLIQNMLPSWSWYLWPLMCQPRASHPCALWSSASHTVVKPVARRRSLWDVTSSVFTKVDNVYVLLRFVMCVWMHLVEIIKSDHPLNIVLKCNYSYYIWFI